MKRSVTATAAWTEAARQYYIHKYLNKDNIPLVSNGDIAFEDHPLALKVLFRITSKILKDVCKREAFIDNKINSLIKREGGQIGQIIELGAGQSKRGKKFSSEYEGILYVQTDLEAITTDELEVHQRNGNRKNLKFEVFDIVSGRFEILAQHINKPKTIIVAEGVLIYLTPNQFVDFLDKLARFLRGRGGGYFIFDTLHWVDETIFIKLLRKIFVFLLWLEKAPLPNFKDGADGLAMLKDKGFRRPEHYRQGQLHVYTSEVSHLCFRTLQ